MKSRLATKSRVREGLSEARLILPTPWFIVVQEP